MRTILVKGWMPESIGMPREEVNEKNVREHCIRANRYSDEASCLWAYAECLADWSTIVEDNIDEINAFCDKAAEHIAAYDIDWLEEHFI